MFDIKTARLVVFAYLLFSPVLFAHDLSVAYVQVSRLLAESPQVKQVQEQLQTEFSTREAHLENRQIQIQALQEKRSVVSVEEAKRLERDILSRTLKLKHARKELQQQRQLRQDDEIEHLRKIIREVITEVAQEEKVDMVLESGVLWVSPKVDITEKVLFRLQELAGSNT